MIRLLHSSDWHLGRFLYGRSLLEDQVFALDRLLELIDERKPHALILAGDIFDRSLPPEDAVTLLNRFLNHVIHDRKLPVFLIPGNHDSAERLGFAAQLLRQQNLTIFNRVEDALTPVLLRGDNGSEAMIYGIPFVEPVLIARFLNQPEIRSHDEAVMALTQAMREKNQAQLKALPSVLLCHAFAVGGETSDSEKEISIGGSSQVDARAFAGFTYTALGHLHKPQGVGRAEIRYSGSLLPYSKSEVGHSKSVTEVEIAVDGTLQISAHELPMLRKLRYIEGTLEELVAQASAFARQAPAHLDLQDYVIAGLTNSGAVFDAFTQLRGFYMNLLHVSRVSQFESENLPALTTKRADERSDLDLFAEFFEQATGENLSNEERAALIECWSSAERGMK